MAVLLLWTSVRRTISNTFRIDHWDGAVVGQYVFLTVVRCHSMVVGGNIDEGLLLQW